MAQLKDDAITVDVRKYFSKRLRAAAQEKIAAIELEYAKLYESDYYEDEINEAKALLALIKSKKLSVADVDWNTIQSFIKSIAEEGHDVEDLYYRPATLFKPAIRAQVKAESKKALAIIKKQEAAKKQRIAAVTREVERLEEQTYFGKGASELRKALLAFTKKKF